ncbi:MAG TPA: bifunctional methylenetetrahydrofolate dehydrogenase/methenyltetrahydrofolate cyclohydrolase FolD [Candidatus Aphodousia gallistercoris]|nr:bifunctional methylenetetrahydrofolate dehydrogenase/methenyltetrahydrofolate cyclohydrolase FolD [Candidatus Aphodousia gallistercoris]
MTAQIIDGKTIAAQIRQRTKEAAQTLCRAPRLDVIMVGDNPASAVYVRNKMKACREVGITAVDHKLPASCSEETLLETIRSLNSDPMVDGILVQLPLPEQIKSGPILENIDPSKDVDGFHIYNTGKLVTTGGGFKPCTPAGIIELLKAIGYSLEGKHAVILGRSNIVGKPLSMLMLQENATVTITHSHTPDLKRYTLDADVLVAAIGKAKFVKADMVKEGAVVIDVGTNRDENGKLCGDVDTENVKEKAAWITPVPGGVGPMTIAMLLHNTLVSAQKRQGLAQ